jgi:hypothetical protein
MCIFFSFLRMNWVSMLTKRKGLQKESPAVSTPWDPSWLALQCLSSAAVEEKPQCFLEFSPKNLCCLDLTQSTNLTCSLRLPGKQPWLGELAVDVGNIAVSRPLPPKARRYCTLRPQLRVRRGWLAL